MQMPRSQNASMKMHKSYRRKRGRWRRSEIVVSSILSALLILIRHLARVWTALAARVMSVGVRGPMPVTLVAWSFMRTIIGLNNAKWSSRRTRKRRQGKTSKILSITKKVTRSYRSGKRIIWRSFSTFSTQIKTIRSATTLAALKTSLRTSWTFWDQS